MKIVNGIVRLTKSESNSLIFLMDIVDKEVYFSTKKGGFNKKKAGRVTLAFDIIEGLLKITKK